MKDPFSLFKLIACAIVAGLHGFPAGAADTTIALSTAQVQSLGVRTTVVADGAAAVAARHPGLVVVPDAQQRVVAAPLAGMVVTMRVNTGDTVRAGQLLATMSSAQAQELQHDTHVARSQAEMSSATLARDEALYREGLISLARLEASRAQASLAVDHLEERRRALEQAGGSTEGPGGDLRLYAPIAGVVLERQVVAGQRVDMAAPLLRLAALSSLWVEIHAPAALASSWRIGDPVGIAGSSATGRIIALGSTVDAASQSVVVRAQMQMGAPALRPGQAVEAWVVHREPGVLSVPSSAVLAMGDQSVVFVEAGTGRYSAVSVVTVGSAGAASAVRGLVAGSRIVVEGTAALKSLLATRPI